MEQDEKPQQSMQPQQPEETMQAEQPTEVVQPTEQVGKQPSQQPAGKNYYEETSAHGQTFAILGISALVIAALALVAVVAFGAPSGSYDGPFGGLREALGTIGAALWDDDEDDTNTNVGVSPFDDEGDDSFAQLVDMFGDEADDEDVEVDDDQDELRSGWQNGLSYAYEDAEYSLDEKSHVDAYNADVRAEFEIKYPQLTGNVANLDQVNETLRTVAMKQANRLYLDPTEDVIAYMTDPSVAAQPNPFMSSEVSYTITYASDDLLSVCFDDHYFIQNYYLEFSELRTVNVNIKTGEVYELSDVMSINSDVANAWIDGLVASGGATTDEDCLQLQLVDRNEMVARLLGESEQSGRLKPVVFVDADGAVNLGVTYWLSSDDGLSRGWYACPLDASVTSGVRTDSSFWGLLPTE